MSRDALERAYRATSYRVGGSALRVGEPHPWLDALLAARGLDEYVWITAANPEGARLDDAGNRRRLHDLAGRLSRFRLLPGVGVADAGDWPDEPALLALGLGREEGLALARAFGQRAILHGRRGGAAELAWVA